MAAKDTGEHQTGRASAPPLDRPAVVSWCFYDFANSPFTAVVTTFVVAAYFNEAIAPDKDTGTAQWGFMMGIAALVIAVLSPILGAIADHGGRRKPWLAVCTVGMAAGSALLWWASPGTGSVTLVLLSVAFAVVAFEVGMVFYNAMLPGLVPESWLGRISGWAWGLGYVGGLACLVLVLFVFIQGDPPPFGLDKKAAEHVRISGPIVAIWTLLFSLPIFLFTPDTGRAGLPAFQAVPAGLWQLKETIRHVRRYRQVVRFLIARMLYIDGINTLFIFGGLYASGTFGMAVEEVLIFGILLNITAGAGAFGFGWLDDKMGAKPTILISLVGIVGFGIPLLLVESKLSFMVLGSFIGLFFGPVQAASRSLMARMAPVGMETEMFGLYAFSGKSTAFMGPWLVGLVAAVAGQRWGMSIVLPLIILGGLLLLTVRTEAVDPDTLL